MKKVERLYQFEWPGVHLHQLMSPARAWIEDFSRLGSPFSFLGLTFAKGTGSFWIKEEEYDRQGKRFYEKIRSNPKILMKILQSVNRAADDIFSAAEKWNFVDLSRLSTKRLLEIHRSLFKPAETLWRKGQPQNLIEMRNSFLSSKVKAIIRSRFSPKKGVEIFTVLTTGLYDSLLERQDRDFVALLHRTASVPVQSLNRHPAVVAHWKKYTFMTYGWEGPDFSLDHFVSNILQARSDKKVLVGIRRKLQARLELRKRQQGYLGQLSAQERKLAELLRALLDSKAKRVDAHSQTYFLGDKLLAELGKRRGFSINQLRTIDPLVFEKRYFSATTAELNADYRLSVCWWEKGRVLKKYNGKKAEALFVKLVKALPKAGKSTRLSGELAYPGKVRGKVRVVLYAQVVKDFHEGEILVTKMTDPSYVPIMKKAAAIVTDIGGITCHAAIVARELRKPCLIGTKTATKVFKDGDLVEVDANRGMVKKISSK